MKKIITKIRLKELSPRSFTARFASTSACVALLLLGAATLSAAPVNDNFANASVIPPSPPATVTGSNILATFQAGEPNHSPSEAAGQKSVWWEWTPAASSTVTIDTAGSESITDTDGLDTQLAVYTGSTLAGLTAVVKNEDAPNLSGGRSSVTFAAAAGTTYRIAVDGFNGETGNINLNFSGGGTVVTGLVLTVTTTGSGTVSQTPTQPAGGYASNTVVTVVANPTGTNAFLGFTGTDGTNSTDRTNTVTMTSNKTITASFTTNSGPVTGNFRLSVLRIPSGSAGSVTRIPNKTLYQAGEVVTVVAKPAGSRSFLGWTGTAEGNSDLTNTVVMTSDRTITATFSGTPGPVPGAFDTIVGTYNGLFTDESVSTNCSGYFTIKISKNGKFSVKLKVAGKTVAGSGTVDSTGAGVATLGKSPKPTTTVNIQTDITGANPEITGTVTTTSGCSSTLVGDRVVYSSKNPSPIQGVYTFILPRNFTDGSQTNEVITTNTVVVTNFPGTTNQTVVTNTTFQTNTIVSPNTTEVITTNSVVVTNFPGTTNQTVVTNTTFETNTIASTNVTLINPGHSYGTISISKSGQARIRGALADGSKFSQSTTISSSGEIPFFVSLYRGQGFLIGWLLVTQDSVSGDPINWKRPEGGILFSDGIDADITAFGSRFDRTTSPFISLGANAVVEIGGNNSSVATEIIPVEFSNANTVVEKNASANRLLLKLLPTGLVKGKFTSPVTGKTTVLQGAMVQNTNAAFGFFVTTGTRGFFELRNEP
ncbi:MAG: hypothetical protein ABI042_05790 [Verrucomicrobiota bacterium]